MNLENWKEIELNYCGTRVKGMLAHMLLRELEFERREMKRNTLGE
jgi:hypothetical protein